jgi:hypothetical protein
VAVAIDRKIMPDSREEKYTRADRDLLIKVDTKLDAVIETVNDLKNNTVARIEALEKTKASENEIHEIVITRSAKWDEFTKRIECLERVKIDNTQYVELEKRVATVEYWRSWILGIFSIIGVVIALVIYIYMTDVKNHREDLNELKSLLQQHILTIK